MSDTFEISGTTKTEILDQRGNTRLMLAVMAGQGSAVDSLIVAGADPNHCNNYGFSPLHCVSDVIIAARLVNAGAKFDVTTRNICQTPLHRAAKCGYASIVSFLIDAGAEMHCCDFLGNTPLHIAVIENHADVVSLLIARGASFDKQNSAGETPLYSAAASDHENMASILVAAGADLIRCENTKQWTPLHIAAAKNSVKVAAVLILASNAQLFSHYYQGTLMNVPVVDICDDMWRAPVHVATRAGNCEMVTLLIDACAEFSFHDFNDQTPLLMATENNDEKMVSILIASGASLDGTDSSLMTALLNACACGYNGIVEQLVAAGATFDDAEAASTPLHVAVENRQLDTIALLIHLGVDVDAKDRYGYTALFLAVSDKHYDMRVMKQLVDSGCDVDDIDEEECTALHIAVRYRRYGSASLLINSGATIDRIDACGNTPIDIARSSHDSQMVALLTDAKKYQEYNRMISIGLLVQPLDLPVLVTYTIYCATPLYGKCVLSQSDAWHFLEKIKKMR